MGVPDNKNKLGNRVTHKYCKLTVLLFKLHIYDNHHTPSCRTQEEGPVCEASRCVRIFPTPEQCASNQSRELKVSTNADLTQIKCTEKVNNRIRRTVWWWRRLGQKRQTADRELVCTSLLGREGPLPTLRPRHLKTNMKCENTRKTVLDIYNIRG